MTDEIPLLSFPDEDELYERRREREHLDREKAIKQLEESSLDLYQRFNELHEEVLTRDGAEQAVAEAFLPRTGEVEEPQRAQRVKAVVNTVPDALITFSGDGHIQTFNSGAERMFGREAASVIGQSYAVLLPESLHYAGLDGLGVDLACQPGTKTGTRESRGLRADGTEFPMEVSAGTVEIEGRRYGATVMRDITERKRYEQELRRLNESLHHQVQETQAALDELHRTQDQLVQAKKMASLGLLVAGVAHEINTPVGVSVTAASYLLEQLNALGDAVKQGALKKSHLLNIAESGKESAELILSSLQRASDLVQGFKQIAVDQTGSEPREFDLAQQVHDLHGEFQTQLKNTRHRLTLQAPPSLMICADPEAFVQILSRLLKNSLIHAYGPDDAGKIEINLERTESGVRLVYADNGKGMPASELPRIFDPFYTTRRGQGCIGLGLHVVFNLVSQALRGQIQAGSELGHGLRFTMDFPLGVSAGHRPDVREKITPK